MRRLALGQLEQRDAVVIGGAARNTVPPGIMALS